LPQPKKKQKGSHLLFVVFWAHLLPMSEHAHCHCRACVVCWFVVILQLYFTGAQMATHKARTSPALGQCGDIMMHQQVLAREDHQHQCWSWESWVPPYC
jgi:hypothetical protein